MKPIIIIESPNKREKIAHITGYDVEATIGHFMDLDSVEVENNYKAIFDYKDGRKQKMFNLINKCKNNEVYIATDPDREGYAIGYLFYEKIKNVAKSIYRAEFHEITENGIKKGLKEATQFANTNFKYYDSFLGRRVVDRMVGFVISPILLKEIKAKSAGRVQTPALKLIVDRHNEIKEFEKLPLESKLSYQLQAKALLDNKEVILRHSNGGKEHKFENKDDANKILESIKDNKVALIMDKQLGKSSSAPAKPFTTSKLLKMASKKLKLSTDAIQKLAQELFEKGLITYIRTDSEFISIDFLKEMKEFYSPIYKDIYEYKEYKAGKNSQAEAHEAIRITHCHKMEEIDSIITKEKLSDSHKQLYTLIFLNTLCSQLKNAQYETAKIIFNIRIEEFILNIKSLKEKGYKALFNDDESNENTENNEQELQVNLSKFTPNSTIPVNEIFLKEITKNPPKLYLESDFIEVLEKSGIGRPSTYATYIPVLLKREYITINKKRQIEPTKLGIGVIEFLKNHKYRFVLDLNFTKELEEKLDLIKDGQFKYLSLMKEVHNRLDFLPFNKNENNSSSGGGSNINPPSESQLKFCNSIATQLNIKLPEGIENDWKIASKFINDNKNKLDKAKKNK